MLTILGDMTLRQVMRHVTVYFGAVITVLGVMWGVAKPQAEDFVKQTVAQEKFATHEELEKQTKALEELSETVQKQSKAIDTQAMQMGIISNDLGTVKSMQKDTLRAILKISPDE